MPLPLLLLLLLLPLTLATALPASPLNDDVLSLILLKSSLQDPLSSLSSWNEDDELPCNWLHLQCDPLTSRVVVLSLNSLSLSGHLPRGLERLQSLHTLSISNNNLSGELPPQLSLLTSLTSLNLSHNQLSGRIPEDLGALSSLRSLDLSGNSLSGPIPESLFSGKACSSLRSLSLSDNRLEGSLPMSLPQCSFLLHLNVSGNQLSGLPDGVWALSRLRVLDLSRNSFSGAVPETIADVHNLKTLRLNGNGFSGTIPAGLGLCPHLNMLDLGDNSFSGSMPESIQSLTALFYFSLMNNKLSGEIPEWIGNVSNLQHLDLSNNEFAGAIPESLGNLRDLNYLSFSGNMLTGFIPASIAECSKLIEVRLRANNLNGSIPKGLFDLELQLLDLSSNKLSGSIPPGSTSFSQSLRSLDLSDNELNGVIPEEMALYFNLKYLNISHNDLRTRLPPELGSFRNLSVLDFRNSGIYGPIPGDLCDSGSLTVLQLDGNSVAGSIPEEIGNCSSLYLLSLSHNALTGSIPAAISRLKKLKILNLEFNNLTGEIPQQLGTLTNLLAVNISHNMLVGRLPTGGIFQSLDKSALQGNLGICSPLLTGPCKMNVPKPLVLNPNAYHQDNGSDVVTDATPVIKSKHKRFLSISSIVAISAAFFIVLGVLAVALLNVSARRRIGLLENALESICSSSSTKSGGPAVGKTVIFTPRTNRKTEEMVIGAETLLAKATEIGRGVFGAVFKAPVGEGRTVAIKKLITSNIIQYHEDFDREVRTLAKAKHLNLLPLKGYYWTPQLQLLISDYLPGGSLHSWLHARSEAMAPLSWPNRFKITLGTAKGLAYLHQSFRPPIIHYNIKPSNILLDENFNPKITDFGLARLLPKLDKHVISSRFQSAMGYMAPELACQSLRINEKCDVYGFGVLILELVTGRKAVEYGEDDVVILIDQVRAMLEQGNALDCVDQSMGEFPEEEVLPVMKLGLVCTSQIPSSRPSMAEVVQILQVIKTPVLDRMEAF
ncbi:hypothetical protein J5N97_019885 [Dioscorea zingiberensis]|uniref:Protein kinase domain-containing protein n=1 Tax=Dioscorea zingiberensis TaxID=325984 RepID=A0A9D5HCQ4_9LILI|nr:hypothetical protein J5N97_019885 [Dioscorea zingiberensis]